MSRIITLPGLIDPHVHLRDPGQTHKEDFYSGTSAALAGGFTLIVDMPNNAEPITTKARLNAKIASAKSQIVSDIGFHFGTLADNFDEFPKVAKQTVGLKIYLNKTTGNFLIDKEKLLGIYKAWPKNKPILLHAEDDVLPDVLEVVRQTKHPTHICHVSSKDELEFVIKAKQEGLPMTCGVTPHHLFMTESEVKTKGPFALMKPSLKAKADQDFIWNHLDAVDVIESDHAPHTLEEKQGNEPPFGVPGLETTLPLLLQAVKEKRLTQNDVIDRLYTNPKRIFKLPEQTDTEIKVELASFEVKNRNLKTKAGWTPFDGMKLTGLVREVVLRGKTIYKDGDVLAKPGSGQIIAGP